MKMLSFLAGQASDFPVHWLLLKVEQRLIKYSQIASRFKRNTNDRIQHLKINQTLDTMLRTKKKDKYNRAHCT